MVEVADDGSITTKGDANAVVDSSAVDQGRITGVGTVLVPRAALPVLWWRTGEWLAFVIFGAVTRGEPMPAPIINVEALPDDAEDEA